MDEDLKVVSSSFRKNLSAENSFESTSSGWLASQKLLIEFQFTTDTVRIPREEC